LISIISDIGLLLFIHRILLPTFHSVLELQLLGLQHRLADQLQQPLQILVVVI
jgi:hypothetical protein